MAESTSPAEPQSAAASCPICKHATSFAADNRYRPFCSARCQRIDLGNWLDERYVVPGAHASPSSDQPTTAPTPDRGEPEAE